MISVVSQFTISQLRDHEPCGYRKGDILIYVSGPIMRLDTLKNGAIYGSLQCIAIFTKVGNTYHVHVQDDIHPGKSHWKNRQTVYVFRVIESCTDDTSHVQTAKEWVETPEEII